MSVKVSVANDPGVTDRATCWELSLSDNSFRALWQTMGLKVGPAPYQGCLDGRTLFAALANVGGVKAGGPAVSELAGCGFTQRQSRRYLERLVDIAGEAERRESRVIWS